MPVTPELIKNVVGNDVPELERLKPTKRNWLIGAILEEVTPLPPKFVPLISEYFMEKATPEVVAAVNRDLNQLNEYSYFNWRGVSIAEGLQGVRDQNTLHSTTIVRFSKLQLDGIVFGNVCRPQGRTDEETISRLKRWYFQAYATNERFYFNGVSMQDALIKDVLLASMSFKENSNLKNVDFSNSIVTGAEFIESDLENANFSSAYGVTHSRNFLLERDKDKNGLVSPDELTPHHCARTNDIAVGVLFSKANLPGSNFFNSHFSGAEFLQSNLNSASLRNGRFAYASFKGCSMIKADLSGSNFSYANFTPQPTLFGCDFTNLQDANARGANFSYADFELSNISGVNFTGAILTGANLCGAKLTDANLTNARLDKVKINRGQLTPKQALSLQFDDNSAMEYINTIIEYLRITRRTQEDYYHAEMLVLSFVTREFYNNKGENEQLISFLKTGRLLGEATPTSSSSVIDENSLQGLLVDLNESLQDSEQSLTIHTLQLK